MPQEKVSALGEKLTDAACKAAISPYSDVEAQAEVWTEGLLIKPRQGSAVYLPYTEAAKIEPSNYRIRAVIASGDIVLSGLGVKYDGFSQRLVDAWGDSLVKALLMWEPTTIYETRATYAQTVGDSQHSGVCRVRICQTSLLVIPSNQLPTRVPLSEVRSVAAENYKVRVETANKGTFEFSKLGVPFQFFVDKLIQAQRNLEGMSLETVREMLPSANYYELNAVARLMSEGEAARRRDVEAVSKEVWDLLEKRVDVSPLAETYRYIMSIGEGDYAAIGLKKTLDEVYVWFLVPVFGSSEVGGNSLVMEITSETGHATYLFKVTNRMDFARVDRDQFLVEAERVVEVVNDAMLATGFRREPIYLSDERLSTPIYSKYLYAVRNLEELRRLRDRFYGRIIHTSYKGWKEDLQEALLFNVKAQAENERWSKWQLEPEEDTAGTKLD